MTPEQITAIAGAILSLAFSYIPGLKQWYDRKNPEAKRLLMLGLLVVTVAGVFGLACSPWGDWAKIEVTCDAVGFAELVWALVLAIMANQTAYLITPYRYKKIASFG